MTKYILIAVFAFIIVTAAILCKNWIISNSNNKRKDSKPTKEIRQPKIYLYVGIGGAAIFLAIGLFFLLAPPSMIKDYEEGMRIIVFCTFLIFCLPYIFIILLQINWQITIQKDGFTFTNFFRKRKYYKYDEVELKVLSRCQRFYYKGKHIFGISYWQKNWDLLQQVMESRK